MRRALERLERRFGVEIDTAQPNTPYRETIQYVAKVDALFELYQEALMPQKPVARAPE